MAPASSNGRPPIGVLLLPRELERFILREQAEDLLRAPHVVAVDPPRVPYGAIARLPAVASACGLASRQARRLVKNLRRNLGEPRAIVIFHPLQLPLAHAMVALCPGAELWYGRWDRYEYAYDAGPGQRERLDAAARGGGVGVLADVRREREARRPGARGRARGDARRARRRRLPGARPAGHGRRRVARASRLAHGLGAAARRRRRARRPPRPAAVGAWHEDECRDDPDFAACREHPSLVWLGAQDDAAAARLILTADVGIVPFKVEPFNDAGLPYRILKYARLGRRTVTPDLAGRAHVGPRGAGRRRTPRRSPPRCAEHAGARQRPDLELREWALGQTARVQNGPLWEGLERLGIARDA